MILAIEHDVQRFNQIVRGKVRQNLRKYITNSEMIGRRGKDLVSIPVQGIEIPRFRFGGPEQGVGQGEGENGTPIGRGEAQGGSGEKGGDQPGFHILEAELTLEELAELMGEELELPRIQPKEKRNVEGEIMRYTGIRRVGPEGLRHFKRTYRETLKRQMSSGTYDPTHPTIIPIREDKRYRSWKTYPRPGSNAVIFYMMDISGSMSDRRKELVRLTAFWIDTWLKAHYKNLATRYIVHDFDAHEIDADTFYHINTNGGTRLSSALQLCADIIQKEYPPEDWNLYAFQFSDGANCGEEDDKLCLQILQETLLPEINLYCYGEVDTPADYLFRTFLDQNVEDEKVSTAQISNDTEIYGAIKAFLGKGM